MITFNQIATNEVLPGYYGEISTVNANQGVYDYPTKILAVGQKIAAGSADALTRQIIVDPKQAQALFGQGSQLATMCAAILEGQTTIEVHAIAFADEPASATAAGSIVVTAPATASGTIYLYVAGQRLTVGVNATDTAANIATAIASAINDDANLLVTAAIDGGAPEQVDLTAKNAGFCGNEIKIVTNHNTGEVYPAGLALTINQPSGGTANPSLQDAFDVIEGYWFTDFAIPYTDADNLNVLEAELKARFGAYGKQDGVAIIAHRGTFSENYTFTDGRNPFLVTNIDVPADALEPSWVWAAAKTAMVAFWSNQHPARPYKGLVLKGLRAPKTHRTETERRILLSNGCSTWTVNASGEVVLERVVTMNQENVAGIEDDTFMDITTVKTFSRIRYDDNAYISTLYFGESPKILTESEAAAATSDVLVTPKTIDASSKARSQLWIEQGWVAEVIEIRSEVDASDPTRVNRLLDLDITNPLMIIATKLDMRV